MFSGNLLVDNIFIGMFFILGVVFPCVLLLISKFRKDTKQDENHQPEDDQTKEDYEKPQLKPLTAEQIAEIHARGKITPAEKLAEWKEMNLCAPGDGMGGAAWRCRKFRGNCHDCLIDFANEHDEYTPIGQTLKEMDELNSHNFKI